MENNCDMIPESRNSLLLNVASLSNGLLPRSFFFIIILFVRLLALRPILAYPSVFCGAAGLSFSCPDVFVR
jgi:hypothetical protein